ncbi:hypothetical protein D5085_10985 [Ectothiorhodospiraceae bacterium BW-2]|nr:hypothetical protein D5085_10985 [Ectothiorhodospiraceae bacterium BW-2]
MKQLLLLLTAVVIGWGLAQPELTEPLKLQNHAPDATDAWQLPQHTDTQNEVAYQWLKQHYVATMAGENGSTTEAAQPVWQLHGLITVGGKPVALLQNEAGSLERYRQGEMLQPRFRLAHITSQGVEIVPDEAEPYWLYLYPLPSQPHHSDSN